MNSYFVFIGNLVIGYLVWYLAVKERLYTPVYFKQVSLYKKILSGLEKRDCCPLVPRCHLNPDNREFV